MRLKLTLCSFLALATSVLPASSAETFVLKQGDHISLVGNALADRFQHDGWFESLIQQRFPDQQLSFRNLGFAGDELSLRMRCDNFGSPDDWLSRTKTSVVFAFFGYNESYGGPAGLEKFRSDLAAFVKNTLGHQYDGKTAPRIVLFSPIAFENHNDPNLPDGAVQNQNLKLYTEATASIAKANNCFFVDLYTPSLALYAKASKPLTIEGAHLNEHGDQLVAELAVKALFGDAKSAGKAAAIEKVRAAVLDKDFYWFNRYRTVDGYNVYGGRSQLKYVDDVSNWDVLQREMEDLDTMTANRDQRIWAVVHGKDIVVDDSNAPKQLPVKSNKPGPGPHGEFTFL